MDDGCVCVRVSVFMGREAKQSCKHQEIARNPAIN